MTPSTDNGNQFCTYARRIGDDSMHRERVPARPGRSRPTRDDRINRLWISNVKLQIYSNAFYDEAKFNAAIRVLLQFLDRIPFAKRDIIIFDLREIYYRHVVSPRQSVSRA